MTEPKDKVQTIYFKGFTNTNCEFFPCHKNTTNEFNCLFCYCPLVFLECPGPYEIFKDKNGLTRKDCTNCNLPHNGYKQSWNFIQLWLEKPKPWLQKPAQPGMRVPS